MDMDVRTASELSMSNIESNAVASVAIATVSEEGTACCVSVESCFEVAYVEYRQWNTGGI